jgi:flavin-dependent dehydrogenase
MSSLPENVDVLIIGAGPSGAISSALLNQQGHKVLVLEKQQFPRFSIGESLLPQCMSFVEEAGMLEAVNSFGFQYKNGAAFRRNDEYTDFDFHEKCSEGPATTFQVERGLFDKLLADQAAEQGVDIRYEHTITGMDFSGEGVVASVTDAEGQPQSVAAKFVLDASGFGRVLPRLLQLESPSNFPVRKAIFTHIDDHMVEGEFDRNKILITVHPAEKDIWFWTIPFSGGKCSLGVVARAEQIDARDGATTVDKIKQLVAEAPKLQHILRNAEYNYSAQELMGYSANVKGLAGDKYALLGNAGEFLDPVFSSGVTIAMRSASMASKVLHRQLSGENVNWQTEYAEPLKKGIDTFRVFVDAWYEGRFQDVIFYRNKEKTVHEMICAILAGYAWDQKNPYVAEPLRRLNALAELCR